MSLVNLENHHGVMDAWAAENVPGYVSRAPGSPAMALTKEAQMQLGLNL